jgi:hypothetical protein
VETRQQPSESTAPADADTSISQRAQRLRVLHDLAQQARPLERPSATAPAAPDPERELPRAGLSISPDRQALWARAKHQRLQRAGIIVLLVALVAGAVVALQGGNPFAPLGNPFARSGSTSRLTTVAATPFTIDPSTGGVDCLVDTTWSPQGTSIAAIGAAACDQGPTLLAIFDASSGRMTHQLNLDAVADPVVAKALGVQSNRAGATYQQVLWSQTGRIAVLFVGLAADQAGSAKTAEGLVLTDPSATSTQAFAVPLPSIDPPDYEVWDLTSGKGTINRDSIVSDYSGIEYDYATVDPSLQYKWDSSGGLIGSQPLPNPSDPAAAATQLGVPAGNPTTGPFSIWLNGYVALTPGANSQFAIWSTNFGAWSPDGGRVIDSIQLNGVLQPLGQSSFDASVLSGSNFADAPLLAVRDAGMQAVLTDLKTSFTSTGAAQIAWRPDGKVLAAQAVASTGGPVRNHEVTLYDCVKGRVLVTLTAPSRGAPLPSGGPLLRWSPDGTHLMLFDPALHVLAIWGPAMLPK